MSNKNPTILSYISSACFYIAAIINFFNAGILLGALYVIFGSCFLYSGIVNQNKNKRDKAGNTEDKYDYKKGKSERM